MTEKEFEILHFQYYGSKSSIDLDIMFFIDEAILPNNIEDCKSLLKELETLYINKYNPIKKVNGNFCVLDVHSGTIKYVYKGIHDECNNSLFYTYKRHEQIWNNLISNKVERNIGYKQIRILRHVLSFFSKTKYRKEIKEALLSDDLDKKLDILNKIKFIEFFEDDLNKNESIEDIWKTIAFQILCGIQLFRGVEIFSKEGATSFYPSFINILNRKQFYKYDLILLGSVYKKFLIMDIHSKKDSFEFLTEKEYDNKYKPYLNNGTKNNS